MAIITKYEEENKDKEEKDRPALEINDAGLFYFHFSACDFILFTLFSNYFILISFIFKLFYFIFHT